MSQIPDGWQGMIVPPRQHNHKKKGWLAVVGPVNDSGTIQVKERRYFLKSLNKARKWLAHKTDVAPADIEPGRMYPQQAILDALRPEPAPPREEISWWNTRQTVTIDDPVNNAKRTREGLEAMQKAWNEVLADKLFVASQSFTDELTRFDKSPKSGKVK